MVLTGKVFLRGMSKRHTQEHSSREGKVGLKPTEGSRTKPSPPPSSTIQSLALVPRPQPLSFQRNQTSQVFKEHQVSLAEASLPFLPPDVFLFLSSFKHHPSPDFVISFLDNRSGYHVAFSAQLSPFWVYLAMIAKTFFLNDFLIMKVFTPSFTLISCDAVSEAQTSLLAFQILHDLAPTCMAHGESGLFSFELSQVLPCSLSMPDSSHLHFLSSFL